MHTLPALKIMNILGIIFVAVVTYFLFTSLFGFYTAIRPQKYITSYTPDALGLPYEKVSFVTEDDVRLAGWFIPSAVEGVIPSGSTKLTVNKVEALTPGRIEGWIPAETREQTNTIILLHGYPADKGDMLPSLAFLHDRYNLFLFDFRYMGESGGRATFLGAKETEDLKAAIAYLKNRGIGEVGVYGFSMGAAVALMTAPEAAEIRSIVAEGSYARLDLLSSELYRVPLLRHPLGWLTALWGKIFLGIDARDVSPEDSARKITVPVLLIHSKTDQLIPFAHAERLKDALQDNPNAELWVSDALDHGDRSSNAYRERIQEFFLKHL